jgi:SAM-dependent methyltransferase
MLITKYRSNQKELMDTPEKYPLPVLKSMYQEINIINKYLFGDYFILKSIKNMVKRFPKKKVTILDLGCGNGDLLRKIKRNMLDKEKEIVCVGYDPYLVTTGGKADQSANLFLYDSWENLTRNHTIDISTTSLTLHHLYDSELEEALDRLFHTPTYGFVVCDLIRSIVAFYAIKVLTSLFSRSFLVKNDAPQSVLRGFSRTEMEVMQAKANSVARTNLKANIAFRWMLVGYKKQ